MSRRDFYYCDPPSFIDKLEWVEREEQRLKAFKERIVKDASKKSNGEPLTLVGLIKWTIILFTIGPWVGMFQYWAMQEFWTNVLK